jgi:hypothetical protein
VSDHAALVRIRDRTRLELLHGGESFLCQGLHLAEEIVAETHA